MRSKISFFVLSSWFSLTCFLDFLVVPLLFKNISNFFQAGKLGIKLFSSFNIIEIIFAVVFLLALIKRGNLKKYILAVFLLVLTLFYQFYLIPRIGTWAQLWESHIPTSSFDHQLYRYLDMVKIFILGFLLLSSFKNKKTFIFSER